MATYYMTRKGWEALVQRIDGLKRQLNVDIAGDLKTAAEHQDFSENAEWDAALEKQGLVKEEIRRLDERLAGAKLIDGLPLSDEKVTIGTRVSVYDLDAEKDLQYTILGEEDADVERLIISYTSPLARGLIGKMEDEEVAIKVPAGIKNFLITKIELANLDGP